MKTLTPELQRQLRDLIERTSIVDVSRRSHIGELALAKLSAGLTVHRGTVALAKEFLAGEEDK